MARPTPHFRLESTASPELEFIDRHAFLDAFAQALGLADRTAFKSRSDIPRRDEYPVLAFYGIGGIGKSSLLREFERCVLHHGGAVQALLDFRYGEYRSPTAALFQLRTQLRRAGVQFPHFEIAYAAWHQAAKPDVSLRRGDLSFLEDGELAAEVIDAIADLPGADLFIKIPRALKRLSAGANEWWTRKGERALRGLGSRTASDIQNLLPAFWARDVRDFIAHNRQPIVLLLDTYEALWDDHRSTTERLRLDSWVREWVAHLPGVLWVIAGRSRLVWEESDPAWSETLEQYLVSALSPDDTDVYLSASGVKARAVRSAIVDKSAGVPLYLDLAAGIYHRIEQEEGRIPNANEFDETLPALFDRFFHQLDDTEQAALLVLSVPESFDRRKYSELMTRFQTGYGATAAQLKKLTSFSFIESNAAGEYVIHALAKEALAACHDVEERREVHLYLFDVAKLECSTAVQADNLESTRLAFREAIFHGQRCLSTLGFIEWFTLAVIEIVDAFSILSSEFVFPAFAEATRSIRYMGERTAVELLHESRQYVRAELNKTLEATIVILLKGINLAGQPVYVYLELQFQKLADIHDDLNTGENFDPAKYGRVLAAGEGEPDAELKKQMDENYNLRSLEGPQL